MSAEVRALFDLVADARELKKLLEERPASTEFVAKFREPVLSVLQRVIALDDLDVDPPARKPVAQAPLYCEECGSDRVECSAWVLVNTGQLTTVDEDGRRWCPACAKIVELTETKPLSEFGPCGCCPLGTHCNDADDVCATCGVEPGAAHGEACGGTASCTCVGGFGDGCRSNGCAQGCPVCLSAGVQ